MRSFFKSVFANIVAFVLIFLVFVFIAIIFVAVSATSESKPIVKSNSVLVIDDKTSILDSPTEEQFSFFNSSDKSKTALLYDVLEAIKKAKTDDKIKGISIETDDFSAGITQIDDIRNALVDFKKSGKFVYAYGNAVSQASYYLGTVADKYFLHPAGGVDLKGLGAEVTFYKGFTDKYGIGVQVIRHGKYKSAVEPYLREDISPENKEQLSTILNDIWSNVSNKIEESRKISPQDLKVTTDSLYGMIPKLSLEHKLVDAFAQKAEYDAMLKTKIKVEKDKKLNTISLAKYTEAVEENKDKSQRVAILYASGAIYNGEGYNNIFSTDYLKYIKELQDDDKVKAVVLRVNSPGGSANASDEILFQLKELKKKKPLIVSFGDYAASGGYYIAMAADKIYSEPNTLTGSIGVFGLMYYFKDIAAKNGIRADQVTTNENSRYYSPINGVSPRGVNMLTRSVESTYNRFVGFVSENRKKNFADVDAIGGGRVWSGTRGKEIGLVDELGSLEDAVKFAAKKANLKDDYSVSSYPKKKSKFDQIFSNISEEDVSAKILQNKVGKENYKVIEEFSKMKNKSEVKMEWPYQINYK